MKLSKKTLAPTLWLLMFAATGVFFSRPASAAHHVEIASPADGTQVVPGQIVKIAVTGDNAIETPMIITDNPLLQAKNTESPLLFLLTIPTDIPAGVYHLKAMSQANGDLLESNPVAIQVTWPSNPVSIKPDPSNIPFDKIGENEPLRVIGIFADGSKVDVAGAPATTYRSQNPDVATVSTDGVVTSLSPGNTTISIQNGTATGVVTVSVGDNARGRVKYDLAVTAEPVVRDANGNYVVNITIMNRGNIPMAFVKITEATLNQKSVNNLPLLTKNFIMGKEWKFSLVFPSTSGKQGDVAELHIGGMYSALPEGYGGAQGIDFSAHAPLPRTVE